ncbi:LCP family protein [Kitasatospora sp. NPDC088783]|uniref:LCP family protein n=1 Tax=Kitasatospora sp. NPDC088783 TaxID=3364077 RepID=UPI003810D029
MNPGRDGRSGAVDGGAGGAARGAGGDRDGEGAFEVQLGAAFGLTGGGPGPEVTARLVDGGLAAGRRRRRARRRRTVLLAGVLTAAVAVGAGVLTVPRGVPGEKTSVVDLAHSGPDPAPPPLAGGVTVLLVGLDTAVDARGGPAPDALRRDGLHGSSRSPGSTDTVMLVHVPAGGGEVRQLSLPRDVYVTGASGEEVPLDQVYPDAARAATEQQRDAGLSEQELWARGQGAGRQALLRAVEQLTSVRVDHYAELSLVGFYHAAEALGGVPVCLNHPVDDAWSGARLPAGRQELDPAQALAFVRQRRGVGTGTDIERTRRAQAFLAGVVEKLRGGGVLAEPGKLTALYRALQQDLVVDTGWSPVDFVRQVPALAAGRGTLRTLPVVLDGSRLRGVPGAARKLLEDDPATPAPAPSGSESAGQGSADQGSAVQGSAADAEAVAAAEGSTGVRASPDPSARVSGLLPEPVELGGVPCVD